MYPLPYYSAALLLHSLPMASLLRRRSSGDSASTSTTSAPPTAESIALEGSMPHAPSHVPEHVVVATYVGDDVISPHVPIASATVSVGVGHPDPYSDPYATSAPPSSSSSRMPWSRSRTSGTSAAAEQEQRQPGTPSASPAPSAPAAPVAVAATAVGQTVTEGSADGSGSLDAWIAPDAQNSERGRGAARSDTELALELQTLEDERLALYMQQDLQQQQQQGQGQRGVWHGGVRPRASAPAPARSASSERTFLYETRVPAGISTYVHAAVLMCARACLCGQMMLYLVLCMHEMSVSTATTTTTTTTTAAAAAVTATTTPPGVYPGEAFFMSVHERRVRVVCPPNVGPGAMIRVQVPVHPHDRHYTHHERYQMGPYVEDDNMDCFSDDYGASYDYEEEETHDQDTLDFVLCA